MLRESYARAVEAERAHAREHSMRRRRLYADLPRTPRRGRLRDLLRFPRRDTPPAIREPRVVMLRDGTQTRVEGA